MPKPEHEDELPKSCFHDISVRVMVWGLCLMCMFTAGAAGTTSGVLTALENEFGLDATQMGMIAASNDVGSVLFSPVIGWLGVRNPPRWMGCGFMFAAAAATASGLSPGFVFMLFAQAMVGVGSSMIWILGPAHIDRNVKDKAAAAGFVSWILATAPLGAIVGFLNAGIFLTGCPTHNDISCHGSDSGSSSSGSNATDLDCSSWRYSYFTIASVLAPLGLWFLFSKLNYRSPKRALCCQRLTYETDSDDEDVHQAQEEVCNDDVDAASATLSVADTMRLTWPQIRGSTAQILTTVRVQLVMWAAALSNFQALALLAFMTRYLQRELCVEQSVAAILSSAIIPFAVIGSFLGGMALQWMEWGDGHTWKGLCLSGCCSIIATPLLIPAYNTDSVKVFMSCLAGVNLLVYTSLTPRLTGVQRMVAKEHRGIALSWFHAWERSLGSIPGPIVLGALLTYYEGHHYNTRNVYRFVAGGFIIMSGMCFLLAATLQYPHDQKILKAEQASLLKGDVNGDKHRYSDKESTVSK